MFGYPVVCECDLTVTRNLKVVVKKEKCKMFRICKHWIGSSSSVPKRFISASAIRTAAKSDKERFDEPENQNPSGQLVKINRRYQGWSSRFFGFLC